MILDIAVRWKSQMCFLKKGMYILIKSMSIARDSSSEPAGLSVRGIPSLNPNTKKWWQMSFKPWALSLEPWLMIYKASLSWIRTSCRVSPLTRVITFQSWASRCVPRNLLKCYSINSVDQFFACKSLSKSAFFSSASEMSVAISSCLFCGMYSTACPPRYTGPLGERDPK